MVIVKLAMVRLDKSKSCDNISFLMIWTSFSTINMS